MERGRRGLLFFSLPFQKWNHPNFWRRPRFSRSKAKTGFRTQEKSVCLYVPLLNGSRCHRLERRCFYDSLLVTKEEKEIGHVAVKFINLRLLSLLSGKFLAGKQSTSTNRKVQCNYYNVVGRFSPFFEHPLRST